MVGLPPHPKIKKHNKEHKKEEVLYLKICMRVDKEFYLKKSMLRIQLEF